MEGVKIHRLRTATNLGSDMPIMPDLFGKMLRTKTDIIHAHEFYNYASIVASAVAKRVGIPFTFTQERYYFVKRKMWKIPYLIFDRTLSSFVRRSTKSAVAFTNSAKIFLSQSGYPLDSIEVIPMSIDADFFRPSKDSAFRERLNLGDEPLILSVARLHRSKGLDALLVALSKVKERIPDVKLVIVGKGPEETRLRSLARFLRLADNVIFFTDLTTHDVMPRVYASCDLFVLPSLYEPFGVAVVEAMACGKPVVASDVGGMRDTVKDGVNGFKVPMDGGDRFTRILEERILLLLEDGELRREFGQRAREHAELFDWRKNAKRYERFYERLIGD